MPTIEGSRDARHLFIAADAAAAESTTLTSAWEQLCSGRVRIAGHFYASDRAYVVVERTVERAKDLSSRNIRLLEAALSGQPLKVIAVEGQISLSSVSLYIGRALRAMGVAPHITALPILYVMAFHAHRRTVQLLPARVSHFNGFVIMSVERPDGCLRRMLAPAEWSVAERRLQGASHREIAVLRQASVRTIANQLASIFRKLQVSGRNELLRYAIRTHATASLEGGAAAATHGVGARSSAAGELLGRDGPAAPSATS